MYSCDKQRTWCKAEARCGKNSKRSVDYKASITDAPAKTLDVVKHGLFTHAGPLQSAQSEMLL